MPDYLPLTNAMLSDGKPCTTAIAVRFRNNPIALYENTICGAHLTDDVTNATTSYVDATELNVTAPAGSVWRLGYALSVQEPRTAGIMPANNFVSLYFKVTAASLAATPGRVMIQRPYFETAGGTRPFYLTAGAVDADINVSYDTALMGADPGNPAITMVVDSIVYVGAGNTTIKLQFKCGSVPNWEDATLFTGSLVLAQEISGSV